MVPREQTWVILSRQLVVPHVISKEMNRGIRWNEFVLSYRCYRSSYSVGGVMKGSPWLLLCTPRPYSQSVNTVLHIFLTVSLETLGMLLGLKEFQIE